MKENFKLGVLIILFCTIFTSVGQLFFKYSSETFTLNIFEMLTNYNLLLGFLFYGVGAALLIVGLKFGDLSRLYPIVSLNFVWVTIISVIFLGEKLNSFKINAVILVIFGVVLIGGSQK
jgi:undecaprenyl phosphate-alpha-L-ara4N flippase subunit ArnE